MSVFPVLVDSRPAYLGDDENASLLLMPLGPGTVLSHIAERLGGITRPTVRVVRAFDAGPAYDAALRATGLVSEASIPAAAFSGRLSEYEPSDWLLLIDARCIPADGFDVTAVLSEARDTPRIARHLIALASNPAGTSERVEFDSEHRVRCVQRYYDSVTWTVARGVSCSLVPVSSLRLAPSLPFGSLVDLRKALAAMVMPAQDMPIAGPTLDLASERALLALNGRFVEGNTAAPGDTNAIHSTARLIGSVVVQRGASVAERAVVIGPSVIGAGARIGAGAVIAQSVVAAAVQVPEGTVARHRLVTASQPFPAVDHDDVPIESGDGQLEVRQEVTSRRLYPALKWAVEAVVVLAALIVLSPILLIIAALVKLDSRGPVLYGDPREAKGGRVFRCYKFRTMQVGAHAVQRELAAANQVDGPQFKMRSDPRVTRVGKWLRKTSLDELPQLFNVLMGQMSLVGPRPSPFRENQTCVPWREARLSVRPGITGLWQVCRHDREAGDFHQWIYYDIQYIRHQSFLVDLKILAATLWTGGGRSHVPLSWIISSARNEHV